MVCTRSLFSGSRGVEYTHIEISHISGDILFDYGGCNLHGVFPPREMLDFSTSRNVHVNLRKPSHVRIHLHDNPHVTDIDMAALAHELAPAVFTFDIANTGIVRLPDEFFFATSNLDFVVDADQLRAFKAAHPRLLVHNAKRIFFSKSATRKYRLDKTAVGPAV